MTPSGKPDQRVRQRPSRGSKQPGLFGGDRKQYGNQRRECLRPAKWNSVVSRGLQLQQQFHSRSTTNVDLTRAGIAGNFFGAVDLWNGNTNALSGTTLPVSLNAAQAKLFKSGATCPYICRPAHTGGNRTGRSALRSLFGNAGSVYAIDATAEFRRSWNTVATITNSKCREETALVTLTNPVRRR